MGFTTWLKGHALLLQLIGLAIGLAGFCFGFMQRRNARIESRKLHDKLNEVWLSLSTRYTKQMFPDYLSDLAQLVSRTVQADELLIIVDYVGAGHYSYPEAFRIYFEAIMAAKAKKIRMLVYGEEAAKDVFKKQFKKKADGSVEQDDLFAKYFAFYDLQPQIRYEDFLNTLARKHGDFCEAFARGPRKIDIRVVSPSSMREGFWFWMIRDREMIFASPSFAEKNNKGLAFFTKDNSLMQVFLDRFEDRWQNSDKVDFDAGIPHWPRRAETLFGATKAQGAE
jgi:hypothetical protein